MPQNTLDNKKFICPAKNHYYLDKKEKFFKTMFLKKRNFDRNKSELFPFDHNLK